MGASCSAQEIFFISEFTSSELLVVPKTAVDFHSQSGVPQALADKRSQRTRRARHMKV
jgi:hypothetical protein